MNHVHTALKLWPLEDAKIESTAHRENVVHRISSRQGSYAIRFHRPDYHDLSSLESELQWMAALAARDIEVPTPLVSRNGHLIEVIDNQCVDMLSWMPGKPMGSATTLLDVDDRQATLFSLGVALAQLHNASDDWTPPPSFKRHAWDLDGLLGESPFWGRFWENPLLTVDERELLTKVREMARDQLAGAKHSLDYGLIHADPVRENVLLHGRKVCLIDFDDGGFGFRLFDIATVLLKCRNEPDYETLKNSIIAGYHSARRLNVTHLDLMLALRAFTYLGWIVPRQSEDWAPQRFQRFKQDALHYAQRLVIPSSTYRV